MFNTRLSSGAGTIGQLEADVPSGLSLTTPQEVKETKTKNKLKLRVVLQKQTWIEIFDRSLSLPHISRSTHNHVPLSYAMLFK
jgi:hypothetical protein